MARVFLAGLLLMPGTMAVSAQSAAEDERLAESRALVAEFASELQVALKDALQTRGVPGAIESCRDLAPEIASALSRRSGAKVSRTSTRFRNPMNAPESWQVPVLDSFARQLPANPERMPEYFEADAEGARYMRAIPLAPLCATCHGTVLDPSVLTALADHYPHDLATGYSIGELRGAFSVYWPVLSPEDPVPASR